MLTVKNCTKSQKEIYVLFATCVDDLAVDYIVYIFDTEEDMMEKFEELKHQDIAFLIDEDRENEILKNTDEYYRSSNSDGTSSYELCTRVQTSKENA
jgi:hypothetical protein